MIVVAVCLSYPLGWWMNRVLESRSPGQTWKGYALSLLTFNAVSFVVAGIILILQSVLPLNPDRMGSIRPDLIFHTLASFVANTNQQHYSGESTMSYFSQLFSLMWLQFVSAGTGLAALTAIARGLSGKPDLGNFHYDLRQSVILVLLPLTVVEAIVLLFCGVPMTFHGSAHAVTLEGVDQIIARGPVAAFVAIKQLGTNGGGFFGANSVHPFENPNLLSNWIETLSIFLLPMACVWLFGRITGRMRHAAVLFGLMLLTFVTLIGIAGLTEHQPTTALQGMPVTSSPNLEGKELRLGALNSSTWAVATTVTSNGSVNAMHDSLNPLTGLFAMIGMWINAVFGGVGVGMLNLLVYIVIGVFICGMMVGRSPEYMNRKVETREMRLAVLALLLHPLLILGGTALFCTSHWGVSTVANPGSHGFSEILYEFTSASANNGSGFEGLRDNTVPWNLVTGIVMLLARFIPILLPLMIAGSLAGKQSIPETAGTFRTDTIIFAIILLGSIMFIGALLFLPVAFLGPVAEHLGGLQ
jgi:K+-transporting ATPase ATPase A chain